MAWTQTVDMGNGTLLAMGGGIVSGSGMGHACIILPVDQIEDLPNDKIGEYAKLLIHDARAGSMLEKLNLLFCNDIKGISFEELEELEAECSVFEDCEMLVPWLKKLRFALNERRDERRVRAAKKSLLKKRRIKFASEQAEKMLAIIHRDGHQCSRCLTTDDLTLDHIVPVEKGGSDDLDNLQILCRSCNSKKGNR